MTAARTTSKPRAFSTQRVRPRKVIWPPSLVLGVVTIAVLFPGLVSRADPLRENISQRLVPPSLEHWFGTDEMGRDLFSRVVYGAQASFWTALLALAFALTISTIIGLIAGYFGGLLDRAFMAVADILLALPSLLVSLLIVSGLGSGPVELAVAVGLASVPVFARLTRAEVLRASTATYVEAAKAFGLATPIILLRHVLPRTGAPLAALAALELATIILSISALSFLGYGVQPPQPELGNLIALGSAHFTTAWWLTVMPGLVLSAVVVAMHSLGRSLGSGKGQTP